MRFRNSFRSVLFLAMLTSCTFIPFHKDKDPKPELPKVQLVQSIPVETSLAQPDLPYAKDVWVEMVREAKNTVDMGEFYVSNVPGSELEPFFQELEKAGNRGVKIRILLSKALIDEDEISLKRLQAISGAEVKIYDISKLLGGILHAKYFVVDGQELFIGSQNFDWRAMTHIHETGIRVRSSELAKQLTDIFNIDWQIALTGVLPEAPAPSIPKEIGAIEMVASPEKINPPGTRPALKALLELLNGAKAGISFQLLSYHVVEDQEYWGEIDNAIRAAASRGVKVQMMVSDWNTNHPAVDYLKSLQMVPGIQVKIASIPEWSGGYIPYARVIHSKLLLVDNQILWLGTSNWSKDYFYSSRNVELIFRMPELAAQGRKIYDTLWSSSYTELLDTQKEYIPRKHN